MTAVLLTRVTLEPSTQPRVMLDQDVIQEYADLMKEGRTFPPVVVFSDGKRLILADGWHRYYAAEAAGLETIDARQEQGGLEEAQWFAASANAEHGLRRTNEDKRRAIVLALKVQPGASDRKIADHCGVTAPTVGRVRRHLEDNGSLEAPGERNVTRGGQQFTRKVPEPPRAVQEPARGTPKQTDAPKIQPAGTRTEQVRTIVEMVGTLVKLQRQHKITAAEAAQEVRNPKAAAAVCDEFAAFAGAFAGLVKKRAG